MIWWSAIDNTASGPIAYQSDIYGLTVLRKYDLWSTDFCLFVGQIFDKCVKFQNPSLNRS